MSRVSQLEMHENTIITKERVLVYPGKVFVEEGQVVDPDTEIARTELLPGQPAIVNVTGFFGIEPGQIAEVMLKRVGDKVQRKEPIAKIERSLIAGGNLVLESAYDGLVEHISYSKGHVLIREEVRPEEPHTLVHVARMLNISPTFMGAYLRVVPGEQVTPHTILAANENYLGEDGHIVQSPTSGVVDHISYRDGTIAIVKPYRPTVVKANLSGRIKEVIADKGAVIETQGAYIQGVFGLGYERYGPLKVLVANPEDMISEDMISEELASHIIVGGSGISLEAWRKALEIGINGVILGSIRSVYISRLLGAQFSTGITGQEDIPAPLILTEGFGQVPMTESIFRMLKKYQGYMTFVNGTTQIRAGVQRPEIVICHGAELLSGQEDAKQAPIVFEQGAAVRIIGNPHFGSKGTIVDIALQKRKVASGISFIPIKVQLRDGTVIETIENNLELLE